MRLIFFTMSLMLILSWAPCGWSQQDHSTTAPIQIEADRMETSQDQSVILFSGHVQASQDALVINADEMTVRYAGGEIGQNTAAGPDAQALTQQIESIDAQGNVKIVQGKIVATGNKMEFDAAKRMVTLSENAKAWQDQNMVSGEKIILYLDEGRSVVERSTQEGERVKAFIFPSTPERKEDEKP